MAKKLFDFCIGNPPYQTTQDSNNRQDPIYPAFYDAAEQVSENYLLISPARFLFNAGLTPKEWNKKMLNDEHIRVEQYFPNSSEVFSNTNINGGIAIVYRDHEKRFQPIRNFIPNPVLRKLAEHFFLDNDESITSIMYGGRSDLKFNESFISDYPDTKSYILKKLQQKHPNIKKLAYNEEFEIKSSSFERTPYAFTDVEPNNDDYYAIIGVEKGKRTKKWVQKKHVSPRYPSRNNIDKYKVYISKADGAAGQIGKPIPARIIGKPEIAGPSTSFMPTFISIGNFDSEDEAINVCKYMQTKTVRALIGILKVTQDITPEKCKYVPLQNFTQNSDIDWSKSVHEIDLQLYRKYGLSVEEIDFIETHVKEMI